MAQLEYVWEDMIYDRCTALPTIADIDEIPASLLPHLAPLLGFTSDLSFSASTEELRRILSLAVVYWNEKPTELGVVKNAVRMVTGNRFRVANWFDFRMQTDKTVITEELEDFDPHVIGFLTDKLSGTELAVTAPDSFEIDDISQEDLPDGFTSDHQFRWLLVDGSGTAPSNDGIYEIDDLNVGGFGGTIVKSWPGGSEINLTWTLVGHAAEYTTELRLVDEGVGDLLIHNETSAFGVGERAVGTDSGAYGVITSVADGILGLRSIFGRFIPNEAVTGTGGGAATVAGLEGVLNRDLLVFLMGGKTVKPFSERIDVVYINFLDQFLTQGDLDQWLVNDPDLVSVPGPAGPCLLAQGGRIQSANPNQSWWGDQVTAWKIVPQDTTSVAHLTFMGTDDQNHYYVVMNYNAKNVSLYKVVSGTPTQIGSTVGLSYLKVGVADLVRVDALAEGSETRIRVKVNGETEIDQKDTAGSFSDGRVGAYALTDSFTLNLVEVNVLPTEIERVGPNP
jgi:hypothetical protein